MMSKIVGIGNSLGVIIPKRVANVLALKKGDNVTLQTTLRREALIFAKHNILEIDDNFVHRVSEFSERYEKDLKRLAE